MRPSKFLFPLSTATATRLFSLMRVPYRIGQRTAVADTGGAAIADQIELEFVEIWCEPGSLQVVGHNFRAGREAGLHPRLNLQTALDRLFRQQTRAEHERWVRRVGAARNRGDDHGAARQFERVAVVPHLCVLCRRAFYNFRKGALGLPQRHAILRPLRAGDRRLDGAKVQLQGVGERGIGRLIGAEQALFLRVRFHQCDLFVRPRGELQVGQRFGINREKAHRCAVFGRHVGDGCAIGNA